MAERITDKEKVSLYNLVETVKKLDELDRTWLYGVAEGMKLAGKTNEKRKSETPPQAEPKPEQERA